MSEKFMKRFDDMMKYPKFEEIDRKDPVAFWEARERWALENLVELETLKIYHERVQECYRREEVNAKQNCRKIVIDYKKAFESYKKKGITFYLYCIGATELTKKKIFITLLEVIMKYAKFWLILYSSV